MNHKTDLSPIGDMIEAAERAVRYASGVTLSELIADEMRSDALLRVLGVLGEASTRVSEVNRRRFTSIPWKDIRGTRNILIHHYDLVNWTIVWSVVTVHIPAMLPTLRAIRDTLLAEEPPPSEVPADA